ncbi:hypothetical protein OHC33_000192 [Knufia fluminis]|uniref:CENP-V/GFA domain-containing protein n=1 Tax=Knufia fluminis TaxID=191047 RepID=A0AAN8EXF6_9EURO|nr:hypothetical protein OHC33_000192 [Knufia fluminis]
MTYNAMPLSSPPTETFKEKLVKYATSDKISRYWCSTCGSHVANYHGSGGDDQWKVCTGAIDEVLGEYDGKLEKYTGHIFVADTRDGGLSVCLPDAPSYMEDAEGSPSKDTKKELKQLREAGIHDTGEEMIEAKCHCEKVRFFIKPAENGKKLQAVLCACRSCRLSLGQPIVSWAANVPREQIVWPDGSAFDGNPHQSLKVYRSSEGVERRFCSTCGASVCFASNKEPETLDVAFGILRAKDGSLAKSFFKWDTEKIPFLEDALDQDLFTLVKRNLSALEDA